jgi:inhibitor of cysteine peptidase
MTDVDITAENTEVAVAPGDRVMVRLDENPTTGFQWVPRSPSGVLDLESSEFRPPSTTAPGAAGERTVVFRAARPGHERVHIELKRTSESGAVRDFSAGVTVRAPG